MYTIVVNDTLNQTLLLHVNFLTYVGEGVYQSINGIYLVSPYPVSEVEMTINNTVRLFNIEYVAPFNGLIFINGSLLGNATEIFIETLAHGSFGNIHFKLLINGSWINYPGAIEVTWSNLTYSGEAMRS